MLELMLDRHVIYVLMGMSAFAGVVSKVVVGRTLRKLVAAAESMGKSNHPLMRLVRAKFELTRMISENHCFHAGTSLKSLAVSNPLSSVTS